MYKIRFELGDPSGDGHGRSETLRYTSNYTADAISEAYETAVRRTGFDLERNVAAEYEDSRLLCADYDILAERFGYELDPSEVEQMEDRGFIYVQEYEQLVDMFMAMVKSELPDLQYKIEDDDYTLVRVSLGYGMFNN